MENYERIPEELKKLYRWIGYSENKIPINPLNGKPASSSNPLTWSSFSMAVNAVSKFNLIGIGFVLGYDERTKTNYFGIDLDNHTDKITGKKVFTQDEFDNFASEFINALNSYSEYSHSGEGIHIICKGKLPEGARRKTGCPIEMYDTGRFFTMTGRVVNPVNVEERTEEIKPLWEKYLNKEEDTTKPQYQNASPNVTSSIVNGSLVINDDNTRTLKVSRTIEDSELISTIKASRNGTDFIKLFNGNMEAYSNDHSAADMALCQILAFWTACNVDQMDRIFRQSALYREKWDEKRGAGTYGSMTIENAINRTVDTYTPPKQEIVIKQTTNIQKFNINEIEDISNDFPIENVDKNGDIIIKDTFDFIKQYDLTDTGNAERMYDYFGKYFKYNADKKNYMFWDGRTWVNDNKGYVKKYADEVLKQMLNEINAGEDEIRKEANKIEDEEERTAFVKRARQDLIIKQKNALRVANKAGKDAMISELQHLHDIPASNSEFDKDPCLLNTMSGIVDLRTGEVKPHKREEMLSKNTNCEISFEEPVVWNKFLHEIFERGNEQETEELINTIQKAVGYTLSGITTEQCMFLLYGATGSNGKSTFVEQLQNIMGDYGTATPVQTLMGKKGNQTTEMLFSLAALRGARLVTTGETEEDERLSIQTVKQMTGADTIKAREMYGSSFDLKPSFKIWMCTNNLPEINEQGYAIWRRLYYFPFVKTFTEETRDIDLPRKLKEESAKILGWAVKGFLKYQKEGLKKPRCVEIVLADYKNRMNKINAFFEDECQDFPGYKTKASVLFEKYRQWAYKNNTGKSLTMEKFSRELSSKGYEKVRKSDGFYYIGIKINDDKKGLTFSAEDDNE